MAVGDSSIENMFSYLAVGRETAASYGTYNTCTAEIEFMSTNFKTGLESKVLESVETSRTYSKQIRTNKTVEGEIEFYGGARHAGTNYLLHSAMGGAAIVTATATGETTGGAAFTHTYSVGDFSSTFSGLCFNHRKGDSASAYVTQYTGARVNEFTISSEIEDAVKMNAAIICKDSAQVANDVASALTSSAYNMPLNFTGARFSVETTFAGLTTTSFWHVQSFEFKMINNLKSDSESRRLGTNILDVLPAGIFGMELTTSMRFNTTTAFDAMLANTEYALEIEMLGDTLTASIIQQGIKFQFPRVVIAEAGDPEVGGPDGMLQSEVTFTVLRDISTTTGYAMKALVTNDTSTYA